MEIPVSSVMKESNDFDVNTIEHIKKGFKSYTAPCQTNLTIFRGGSQGIHRCGRRESFYHNILKIMNGYMGKTKSRDICPVIDARFKSPFLVVHVNFFKSLNELANKAEIEARKGLFLL
jgi:hypothetical protein